MNLLYNPYEYSDEDNIKWCWLRGNEWCALPLYLSQIIVPVLLFFLNFIYLLVFILAISWLWAMVRYRFVSYFIANITQYIIVLQWVVSIAMFILFIIYGDYFNAIIALLYPIIVLVLLFLVPRPKIGICQEMFMKKIGYYKAVDGN